MECFHLYDFISVLYTEFSKNRFSMSIVKSRARSLWKNLRILGIYFFKSYTYLKFGYILGVLYDLN